VLDNLLPLAISIAFNVSFFCSTLSQVDPTIYKSNLDGWVKIHREHGFGTRGLYTGVTPTFIGYSFQGAAKYGFYELFKKKYIDLAGEETAHKYRTTLYMAASAR